MHYSLNRENETVLYRFIYLPFKAGLTVLVVRTCYKQVPFKAGLTVLVVRTCYKQIHICDKLLYKSLTRVQKIYDELDLH